jgi:O-6-methylguanine DNA methyltransferase
MPNSSIEVFRTSFKSRMGWIVLASTARGICLLHFCGAAKPPARDIENRILQEYPEASVKPPPVPPLLDAARDAVIAYLEQGIPLPPIPLDMPSGTPFQELIWAELRAIPFGETRTYGEIARKIGRRQASRAVGQACGRNPVAIIVPCHRVLATGGGLGGYAGGVEIKQALLDIEHAGPRP